MSDTDAKVKFHFKYTFGYCRGPYRSPKRGEGQDITLFLNMMDPDKKSTRKEILSRTFVITPQTDFPAEKRCLDPGEDVKWGTEVLEKVIPTLPLGKKGVKFVLTAKMGNRNINLRPVEFALGLRRKSSSLFEIPQESRNANLLRDRSLSYRIAKRTLSVDSDGTVGVRSRSQMVSDQISSTQALAVDSDGSIFGTSSMPKGMNEADALNDDLEGDDVEEEEEAKVYNGVEMTLKEFTVQCVYNRSDHNTSEAEVMSSCIDTWQGKGDPHCED